MAVGLSRMIPGSVRVAIDEQRLREFCARWNIQEVGVLGSALRADFGHDSDLDVLVTFSEDADWSLLDLVRMERELEEIAGRDVDLVDRRSIARSENWLRRRDILSTSVPLCAS